MFHDSIFCTNISVSHATVDSSTERPSIRTKFAAFTAPLHTYTHNIGEAKVIYMLKSGIRVIIHVIKKVKQSIIILSVN